MPAPAPETGDPGGMFLIQGKLSIENCKVRLRADLLLNAPD